MLKKNHAINSVATGIFLNSGHLIGFSIGTFIPECSIQA